MSDFRERFQQATGHRPYPYQVELAERPWPDALSVPTGTGKTAAVGLAWVHRRLEDDPETPRRLLIVLPMRVLAEQTVENFRGWLERLGLLGRPGEGKVSVSLLIGGADDVRKADWARFPEENAVVVGTQDMLLSRALMRGYGMSRYQWPVHFALLHTDAFWVMDEVQLMGPALATTTQLEAFRRTFPPSRPCRSLWVSATLRREWLDTVDFRPFSPSLRVAELGSSDRESMAHLLDARKSLQRAEFLLAKETAGERGQGAADIAALARERHVPGSQTLVIVNRVGRAQEVHRELVNAAGSSEKAIPGDPDLLLLHSRFRPSERRRIEATLRTPPEARGRIIVSTQAVEAGVDITSTTLLTEIAPWASMVQRFGRNNRYGELPKGSEIVWIDIDPSAGPELARPYTLEELEDSRTRLGSLAQAGPAALPPLDQPRSAGPVLRRKDFLQLFDTDPDLSGYDVDIAPYIRDGGSPTVHVFWRPLKEAPSPDLPSAAREELCPVSLSQLAEYAGGKTRTVWGWDIAREGWVPIDGKRRAFVPGQTYLLAAESGGYLQDLGFYPGSKVPVPVLEPSASLEDVHGADPESLMGGEPETLLDHLEAVVDEAEALSGAVGLGSEDRDAVVRAAQWHDVGKAHPAFQTAMRDAVGEGQLAGETLAKSGGRAILQYRVEDAEGAWVLRRHFRHELPSMLTWLAHNVGHPSESLVAFLIAAHHGRVRMGLRALPNEKAVPTDGRRHARGVWEGDILPGVKVPGWGDTGKVREVPETVLGLELMELGRSATGPSWAERSWGLLEELGPFRLSWLESLLRIADWRGSARSPQPTSSPEDGP